MDLRYVNLRFLEPFAPLVPIGGTFNPLWIKLSNPYFQGFGF